MNAHRRPHFVHRRLPRLTLALVVLLALPLRAQSTAACAGPKDVCGFFDSFISALNRRDWDAFRGTFAPGITAIFERPGPAQVQQGRAAVEAVFQNIFPKAGAPAAPLPPALRPQGVVVQTYRDIAIISFELQRQGQLARRTLVFHRVRHGWEVVHIHGSASDLSQP
ncbi:MAG: nuclear transport factor 2 family protein [Gemmatimonadota bacterium]